MHDLLTIALEAHNPERNHHRYYEISMGRDLLDEWLVTIRFGRLGQWGQERRFGGPVPDTQRKVVSEHLRRRLSAPQRIGCPYQITTLRVAPGWDGAAWLPPEVMAHLDALNRG